VVRDDAAEAGSDEPPRFPSFREAVRFWLKLGLISFGGPAGQIAIMNRELVETKRWISSRHFLNALNFCMLLPGPEAQQLATYLGWRLHGARGGIAAGALFVLPSMAILFGLSWLYMAGGELAWIDAIFHGLMPAVVALIADAVLRLGGKALRSRTLIALAAVAFVAIYFFGVSFVLIVLGAGLLGGIGHRFFSNQFPAMGVHGKQGLRGEAACAVLPAMPESSWKRTCGVLALCLVLWWVPIFAVAGWLGWQSAAAQQGLFFSKAAMVTFGGAYAVLPYVAQQAVETHQWLSHPQMMAGLALAETTPGPLIIALQFVGFVGGWQHPGTLDPILSATVCALVTTWVTFLPSFLFIFLGGPYVEKIGNMPRLSAALTAITAAVVGVILNLGVQFSMHAIWVDGEVDWFAGVMAIIAFVALRVFKIGIIPVMAVCAVCGLALLWM